MVMIKDYAWSSTCMYGQDMTYLWYGGRSYGQSPKFESSLIAGFFVFCGINLSPIIKGMKMFYLIKENSLNESRKEYVMGGLGIDYSDPNVTMRHITNKIEEALAFNSEDEANQYLCRGYVVIEQK